MEGDDPQGNPLKRHWVAKRPVGMGLAVWRHGTEVREAYSRARSYNRTGANVIHTALDLETELAKGERIGTLDAFADDRLAHALQIPNDDFETPLLQRERNSRKQDNVTDYAVPASSKAYYPCWPFVGVEIVKENGAYIVLENGRRVQPSRMSPEQKHVFDRMTARSGKPQDGTPPSSTDGRAVAVAAGTDGDGAPTPMAPSSVEYPSAADAAAAREDERLETELASELRPTHGALYYRLNTPPQLLSDGCLHRLHDDGRYQTSDKGAVYLDDARLPLITKFNPESRLKNALFARDQYTELPNNGSVNDPLVPLANQGANGTRAFAKRFPAPLAARVRVEVGQLPPDAVRVTARSVTIGNMDATSGLVEVVEDEPIANFGIPVGNAAAPTAEAAVLPYPLSVPLPPRTILVSQEPRRREIVERWKRGGFKPDAVTGLLSRVSGPGFEFSLTPWAMIKNKVRYDLWWGFKLWLDVARGVGATIRQRFRQQRLKKRATAQAEGQREFVYGDDSKNVFEDIRDDLAEIRTALRAADDAVEHPKETLADTIKDYVLNVTEMTDLTGELRNTEVSGARISKLKGRTRALADFLFPALWFDPDPVSAKAIKGQLPTKLPKDLPDMYRSGAAAVGGRLGGMVRQTMISDPDSLGALDARSIPNFVKNDGMMPFYQSSKRTDLRYEVEINDSQFDRPVKMVLVAREQAGLMAGRVVDDHDALEESFQNLADDLVNFTIDVAERINYHKDGYFAMVDATAADGSRWIKRQSYRFKTEQGKSPNAEQESDDETKSSIRKGGAREWFVDRMVLQRATQGYRKMARDFDVTSIFARMRELLGMDIFPQARIPSYMAPQNTREAYEKAKRSTKFMIDRSLRKAPRFETSLVSNPANAAPSTSTAVVPAQGGAGASGGTPEAKGYGFMRESLAMMNATPLFANMNVTSASSADDAMRAYVQAGFLKASGPAFVYEIDAETGMPMHPGEKSGDEGQYPSVDPGNPDDAGHSYANVYHVPSLVKKMVPPIPNLKNDHGRAQRADLPAGVLERRLPQLVKLSVPFSMRGWEPLAGSTDVASGGAWSELAPLASACRRAARFLGQQTRALVDKETDAVSVAESRSRGDPDAKATDAGVDAPVRRRLQFVSLYALRRGQRVSMNDLSGAAHCTMLPCAFAPPTLPLGASLPHAVSRQFHASLRVMYGNAALLLEDVLGSREAVPNVVASEARNAFASILINCLLARAHARSDAMIMHDAVQSVVLQARQIAAEAARLIKAVYQFGDAAVVADGDELFQTLPEGPVTRLALRHTPAWQTGSRARRTVLRSSVWRFHVRAFADALQTVANSNLSNPLMLPLLNVQTSWLAVRPEGPLPSALEIQTFAQLSVYEAKRSLARVVAIDAAAEPVNITGARWSAAWSGRAVVRTLMFADLVLARPVLWRIEAACDAQNNLEMFTADVAGHFLGPMADGQQVATPPVLLGDLVSAWASRRVALPLRLLAAPLSVADDGLVAALDLSDVAVDGLAAEMAHCNLNGGGDGQAQTASYSRLSRRPETECVYFVPVCCAVWTKMECEFDSSMGMQRVPVRRMAHALSAVPKTPPSNDRLVETLVVAQFGSEPADRGEGHDPAAVGKTEHPLLVFHDAAAKTLRVHIPPTPTLAKKVLTNAEAAAPLPPTLPPHSLRDCMGLLDLLAQIRDPSNTPDRGAILATRDERVDRVATTLVDARRAVLYATDRVYQGLLHACMLHEAREAREANETRREGEGEGEGEG